MLRGYFLEALHRRDFIESFSRVVRSPKNDSQKNLTKRIHKNKHASVLTQSVYVKTLLLKLCGKTFPKCENFSQFLRFHIRYDKALRQYNIWIQTEDPMSLQYHNLNQSCYNAIHLCLYPYIHFASTCYASFLTGRGVFFLDQNILMQIGKLF